MSPSEFKAWAQRGDTSRPVSSTRFEGESSDPAVRAQEEIAQSIGLRLSRRRTGESDTAYHARMAAEANQRRAERIQRQAVPTRANDEAEVRKVLRGMPGASEEIRVALHRPADLPDAGQTKGVSKQAAQFVEQVARVFKKRVVFFSSDSTAARTDGFYLQGNTIYLGTDSSVAHLRVLGHELTHAMRSQAKDAYDQMLAAVSGLLTESELQAQHRDYFGAELDVTQLDQPYDGATTLREFLAEEWMADLSGNRFAEESFWEDVFSRIDAQHGEATARGIIARVRMAIGNALNKLLALIKGNAFAVDARLSDKLDTVRKAVAEGFAEYARQVKTGEARSTAEVSAPKFMSAKSATNRRSDPIVYFEVAPDPNNRALADPWNALSPANRFEISQQVAERILPEVLRRHGVTGRLVAGTGSYLDDTNPSYGVSLSEGAKALDVAATMGVVFRQDGMLPISDQAESWTVEGWQLTVKLPDNADAEYVDQVYQVLHAVRLPDGTQPVQGQTTSPDGYMSVLNLPEWGGVEHDRFRDEVYPLLAKALSEKHPELVYFLDKAYYETLSNGEDYDYARGLERSEAGTKGTSRRASAQGWRGALQAEAADALVAAINARSAGASTRLSPERGASGSNAARDQRLGRDGAEGLRRPVQPESVSAEGIHYSRAQRSRLSSGYFGTGIRGAENDRVQRATDPRIQQRIYFYVNSGRGIKPEEGVGSHAHRTQLDNLYDYINDPLDLRVTNTFSEFESAVLDRGFDGVVNHEFGIAVLLGQRSLPVEYLGQIERPDVPLAKRAALSDYGRQRHAILTSNALPAGEMTGAEWQRLMPKLMPDIDVSHLNETQKYYRDEILKRPAKFSPERKRYEWLAQSFNDHGPVYQGRGFALEAVRRHALGAGDFEIENGLPWGHAAFVEGTAYRFALLDDQRRSRGFLDAEVNELDEISAIHDLAIGLPGTGLGTRLIETILASTVSVQRTHLWVRTITLVF
jgi:hypothetical protein